MFLTTKVNKTAATVGVGTATLQRVRAEMDPFESVGARHFSTHSSNEAALIGRSKAFCATRPDKRKPATSVTVL